MSRSRRLAALVALFAAAVPGLTGAARADQTVGLFQNDPDAYAGYTLYSTLTNSAAYLFDINGQLVNSWQSDYPPGNSQYFRPNGNLLRTADPGGNPAFLAGGDAGLVEEYEWDGTLAWSFLYSNAEHRAHHDIALLPNGNILMVAWEYRSGAQAIAAGRNPATLEDGELWPEHVIEVEPLGANGGSIVWEWHVWDHLIQDFDATKDNFGVVADHPELLDVNYAPDTGADWMHANAIDYNAELDQVMINTPFLREIWIIDHSTTTEEAAGHTGGNSGRGGDFLYRWGNPAAYGAGDENDRRLFNQHDAHWIPPGRPGAGNIMVFNNGVGRPEGAYTSIDELAPPVDKDGHYDYTPGEAYGPEELTWSYTADPPESFFSSFISGAQRLPNGHTLICAGAVAYFFEVRADSTTAWYYENPVESSGRVEQCAGAAHPAPCLPGAPLPARLPRLRRPRPFAAGADRDHHVPGQRRLLARGRLRRPARGAQRLGGVELRRLRRQRRVRFRRPAGRAERVGAVRIERARWSWGSSCAVARATPVKTRFWSEPQRHRGTEIGVVEWPGAMSGESGLTREVIGAAIEVHRVLGPGLLESAYEQALCIELRLRRIPFESQVHLPATYKGVALGSGYCIDLIIKDEIVVELKATRRLLPVHEAQLLTYLRLVDRHIGLLINFNVDALKEGIRRRVL